MKQFLLLIAALSFLTGSWVQTAHAFAGSEPPCTHQADSADNDNVVKCADSGHDHAEMTQCQDCCCHHVHVIAKIQPDSTFPVSFKTVMAAAPKDVPPSLTPSSLYRPPIA